jgi:RNA polymerase sigma factor (TIGR02999 family)
MSDALNVFGDLDADDPKAAAQLLPLVYEELRKLAAWKLAQEQPGQALEPTALVHEAYLRLVGQDQAASWNGRGHFFAAAAEAMRRILVDNARRKQADKRGGNGRRVPLEDADAACMPPDGDLLSIDEALTQLAREDAQAARLIELRYFAGLSIEDAAEVVGIARSTAYEHWSYARVRLRCLLDGADLFGWCVKTISLSCARICEQSLLFAHRLSLKIQRRRPLQDVKLIRQTEEPCDYNDESIHRRR